MTTKIDPIIDEKYCSDIVQNAIKVNQKLEGSLLPILHNIQAKLRCVPESAVKPIAKALNLSRAEVHGVITYYHTFTSTPLGEHVIEVCRAESCQAVGGRSIEQKFKDHLGVNFGETTTDGKITLEAVYCLGNCGCSPAIRIGKKMYGRVSENKVEQIINDIQEY